MKFFVVFLFTYILFVKSVFSQKTPLIDTLQNRLYEEFRTSKNVNKNEISELLKTLTVNGNWPDINYFDQKYAKWDAANHLRRVNELSIAYCQKESGYYHSKPLLKKISTSLKYWNLQNLKANNWWYNEIFVPQSLGQILILLDKSTLNENLKNDLTNKMAKGNVDKQAGANKTDIALHNLYRAVLTNDVDLAKNSVDHIFSVIKKTAQEGIQADDSYAQHGNQLYILAYGLEFLKATVNISYLTRNTEMALSPEKLAILSDFVINGFLPQIRGKYADFAPVGRGISRRNILADNPIATIPLLSKLEIIDPKNAQIYTSSKARILGIEKPDFNISDFYRHYYRTDYTVLNTPKFHFSTRFASNRVKMSESGNGEGLKNGFLSQGATTIMVNGDEYFNIFPVWNWYRIPGTTVPKLEKIPQFEWGKLGESTFAGGVSNGKIGVSTFTTNQWNLTVKKGWFMFENEIVCLGAGITSTDNNSIMTTINQANLDGNIYFKEGEEIKTLKPDNPQEIIRNASWVLHDSVGYFLLDNSHKIFLSNKSQTGSWSQINTTEDTTMLNKKVFMLGFEDIIHPQNVKYGYVIAPNLTTVDAMKKYHIEDLKIIENNEDIQAVYKNSTKTLGIIFYKNNSFNFEFGSLSVTKPCVVLITKLDSPNPEIYIADPSFTENNSLVLKTKLANALEKTYQCTFPTKPESLGSTIKIN